MPAFAASVSRRIAREAPVSTNTGMKRPLMRDSMWKCPSRSRSTIRLRPDETGLRGCALAADQQYDSRDEKIAQSEGPTFAGDIACVALKPA
jgi:hypothetical protein